MLAPGKTSDAAEVAADIASFMRSASLEATRPNVADIAALKAALAPGTPVFLSAIPARPQEELVEQAAYVRAAGLEPVPHLAVRNFVSADALKHLLDRLTGEAGVRTPARDRGRPRRAGRPVPWRAGSDRLRFNCTQRHQRNRHLGLSGRPSAHRRSGARPPARRETRSRRPDRTEGRHRHAVLPRRRADHRLGEAPARAGHRSSGAHRACRADQPHHADALCEALRRARLGAGARAQCRADEAPARCLRARRRHPCADRGEPRRRAWRHRAASVLVRRHRRDRRAGWRVSRRAGSGSTAMGLRWTRVDETLSRTQSEVYCRRFSPRRRPWLLADSSRPGSPHWAR